MSLTTAQADALEEVKRLSRARLKAREASREAQRAYDEARIECWRAMTAARDAGCTGEMVSEAYHAPDPDPPPLDSAWPEQLALARSLALTDRHIRAGIERRRARRLARLEAAAEYGLPSEWADE